MHALTHRFDFDNYFAVLFEQQTYLNLFYLFLSFPLGIAYFVVMVTLGSTGVGLTVIGVGFLILLLLLVGLRAVAAFERQLVRQVLGMPIAAVKPRTPKYEGFFGRIYDLTTDPYTYRASAFVLLKFALGIASFVAAITAVSLVAGLLTSPFTYGVANFTVGPFLIDNFLEGVVAASVGVLLAPIAAHALNLWAHLCGIVARIFLGADKEMVAQVESFRPKAAISTEDEIVILKEEEKQKSDIV